MDDLAAFLNARLDEWERLARQAYPVQTGSRDEGQPPEHVSWRRGPGSVEFGLRQVEAGRAILALLEQDVVDGRERDYDASEALEQVVRICAAVFNGHSDYRPEWKP